MSKQGLLLPCNKAFLVILNLYYLFSIPIFWQFHRWNNLQQNYFVFGVLGLYLITFFIPPKRKLNNVWIAMFVWLSLISVFIHNFYSGGGTPDGIAVKYINYCLSSEGFLYVFVGALLYKLIYEYGEIKEKYYPFLLCALGVWLIQAIIIDKSVHTTGVFFVSGLAFLWAKKLKGLVYLGITIALLLLLKNWNYVWIKFQVRPFVWYETLKSIVHYPFGQGFSQTIMGNVIYINPYTKFGDGCSALGNMGGYIFPHNDYLNIMRDLGVVTIIPIIMYLKKVFKYQHWLKYVCLSVVMLCFGHTTMYSLKDAFVFIPIFSLLEMKGNNGATSR